MSQSALFTSMPGEMFGLQKRTPDSLKPEELRYFYEYFHHEFDKLEDISVEGGVDRKSLVLSMRFIALATRHDLVMCHKNGHQIAFHCKFGVCPNNQDHQTTRRRSVGSSNEPLDLTSQMGELPLYPMSFGTAQRKKCPFCLQFSRSDSTKKWSLKKGENNCIDQYCGESDSPSLCMNGDFISLLLEKIANRCRMFLRPPCKQDVARILLDDYMFRPTKDTLDKGWKKAMKKDVDSVRRQNGQVESYLKELNKKEHYGVILYSNGDFVIPGLQGGAIVRTFLVKVPFRCLLRVSSGKIRFGMVLMTRFYFLMINLSKGLFKLLLLP